VKRGQFQIGFGMIFSIILTVIFMVVAIIAINTFLKVGCSTEQGTFIKELTDEVNRLWNSDGGGIVPLNIKISNCNFEYVCFYDPDSPINGIHQDKSGDFHPFIGDEGKHNLYFYPAKESDKKSTIINHINMDLKENPLCIKKINDSIKITLEKRRSESLVRVL